ncbi:MAG: riboflavin synthase [Verrucomicrobiales bacterium]|nr:riboflavin synthase [Verrucomicrobiales bacterium]
MFTGIVETTARVESLLLHSAGGRLALKHVPFAGELQVGESVAVNGVCLTVVECGGDCCAFDLLAQTLSLTNLGSLRPDNLVNLERAMRADSRFSGHFVQGHVDATVEILAYDPVGQDHRLEVSLPREFQSLVISKGSVCLDGMSLTVAELATDRITVWITPHTHRVTNLLQAGPGRRMNVEFDMLAKYLSQMLELRGWKTA